MKILIADARQENYRNIYTLLKKLNHRVISAVNGSQAYSLFLRESPDLFVLDLSDPVMGSAQLVPFVQQTAPKKGGVLMGILAENATEEEKRKWIGIGVHQFIISPVRLHKFFNFVREVFPQEFPKERLRIALKEAVTSDERMAVESEDIPGGMPSPRYIEADTVEVAGGDIFETPLSVLFNKLYRLRGTGVLLLKSGDFQRSFFVEEGDIVLAMSNEPRQQVDYILNQAGMLSEADRTRLQEAIKESRGVKRAEELLLEMNLVSEEELHLGLQKMVTEVIRDVFQWIRGTYRFLVSEQPRVLRQRVSISMANLIMEGVRATKDPVRLRKFMPSEEKILRVSEDPLQLFQEVDLDSDEQRLLNLMDGQHNLAEVLRLGQIQEEKATALIHGLLSSGIVMVVETRSKVSESYEDIRRHLDTDELERRGRAEASASNAPPPPTGAPGKDSFVFLFSEQSFPEILQRLRSLNATGLLSVSKGEDKRIFYIKEGSCIFSQSNIEGDYLGRLMVNGGLVTEEILTKALEKQKTTKEKRLGEIFYLLNAVTLEDVRAYLFNQLKFRMVDVFSWEEGRVAFRHGPLPSQPVTLELALTDVMFEGFRQTSLWEKYAQKILKSNATFQQTPVGRRESYGLRCSLPERHMINALDGRRTLHEILSLSSLDYRKACQFLLALHYLNYIEPVHAAPSQPAPDDMENAENLSPEAKKLQEDIAVFTKNMGYYTLYDLFGLLPNASELEIKKAYRRMVSKYHPDIIRSKGLKSQTTNVNDILVRLNRAYAVLMDKQQRALYDQRLKKPKA